MSQSIDTLILADWVIPVQPEDTVLHNYGVAIDKGRIIAVEHHDELTNRFDATHLRRLKGHALIPGLINAHTHSAMNLLRGFADDLPLMTWLEQHIWPAEAKHVSEEFVEDGTRLAIAEMLRSGTTCFNDMYFYPQIAARVATDTGIRANIGMVVIDFPTAWANNADEYIHKGLAAFDNFKHQDGIRFSFAPHAPYTVSDAPLKKIATYSQELDLGIHIHLHETAFEVEQAVKEKGQRPIQRLNDLGLLSPSLQTVHMTQLNDDDIRLVSDNGVHVIHCPQSNMKLASGICPTAKLLEADVNLAIGTDGSASNNDLDMLGELQSAALLAKVGAMDASAMPAFTALKAATLNGAKALGIDEDCGSIEVGKCADLCAIDLDRIETQPLFDPVSQIVYSATREQVTHVWVNGKLQLDNRQLTSIDEEQLLDKVKHWQKTITQTQ
ncbi:TRZ/ATZ family hydrolase [Pleionea sp. CnH1-48]|uniref:TRZ/ATZ family hydrolase n=1 Tax=Pleionea sp. CnH1-48 TaxID=2954494 RepID=UPI0020970C5F|nr:TRZ/ATZ family hydrolase [Pleionea sp. CnH1-48]